MSKEEENEEVVEKDEPEEEKKEEPEPESPPDDEATTARPHKIAPSTVIDENTVFTGELLKEVREGVGLTLQELCSRTKINIHILDALEEERFVDVPNARVYVRGFVRCLAREIGLDQDLVCRTYVPRWERWFEEQTES